jgi:hypothetical protein
MSATAYIVAVKRAILPHNAAMMLKILTLSTPLFLGHVRASRASSKMLMSIRRYSS